MKHLSIRSILYAVILSQLCSCMHPPYNNFKPYSRVPATAAGGAAVGGLTGGIASGTLTGVLLGGAIGGAIGAALGIQSDSKYSIIQKLQRQDIQFVQYGEQMTLIIPTDKYFIFNSPRINEICYGGLHNVIKLLAYYPKSAIYVAGFTDNVGSRKHKILMSEAHAETILTYLWAHGIKARRLQAQGFADKFDIGDNKLIHGSAFNRRVEIQWTKCGLPQPPVAYMTK